MQYKPKTSLELNVFHIKKGIKQIKNGEMEVKGCGLNKRFTKLQQESIAWYEDLHPKYIEAVKNLNKGF